MRHASSPGNVHTCTQALPRPEDPAALQLSETLVRQIREEVMQEGGRLPFDRYMELALYAPGLGYYSAGSRKLGAEGDFVTAPESSPLFAQCLARQCHQVLQAIPQGDLLEFGAGSGVLAVGLLEALDALGVVPRQYLVVEVSAELRARQQVLVQERLPPRLARRIRWLDGMPDTGFRGVVIANEVVDAMPVHRFRMHEGGVQEMFVEYADLALRCGWRGASAVLSRHLDRLLTEPGLPEDGFESEINLRAAPWIAALAGRLEAGLILLIDYGYPRAEYYLPERNRGTLMCHYRHRAHADSLFYPGLQDITAHVDFTALAEAALDSGLSVCGYTTQAFFLFGCGLEQLVADSDPDRIRNHMQLMQGVKRLTLPSEMGERFKVLGLSRALEVAPIGFALQDLRGRL